MAEKTLEKQICQICGADVRRNAQFCYNCGSGIGEEADNSSKITTALDEKAIPNPIEKPSVPLIVKEDIKLPSKTEAKLPSAAEIKQKNKSERKKLVETSWEEPESAPNVWFLVVTFILTLFAVGILYAMLYIR